MSLIASPSPEQVRRQLHKMLASRTFAQASRASRFLKFVVESALEGKSEEIKETTVGVAVFDRDPGYDPKTDPVVRNAARRLRDLLERYYVDEGSEDWLRFFLPKGGYSLQIETSAKQEEMPTPGSEAMPPEPTADLPGKSSRFSWHMAILGVALCFFFVSALLLWEKDLRGIGKPAFEVLPITSELGESFQPAFAPNSRDVAYVWDGGRLKGDPNYDIYLKIKGEAPVRFTTDSSHDLHPAWSPDGESLAYLRVNRDSMEVFVKPLSLAGSEKKIATVAGLYYGTWQPEATEMLGGPGPAWMPQGRSILITSASEDGRCCGLFEVAIDGSSRRQITNPDHGAHDFYPAVSPDGRKIAFARYTSHSTAAIYIFDRSRGETRQILFDYSDIRGLAWTHDAKALVFSSNRAGSYRLWLLPIQSGVPEVLAVPSRNAIEPAVSQRGNLAFVDVSDHIDLLCAELPKLTGNPPKGILFAPSSRKTHSPRYSPDGTKVVFLSDRSGTMEVWVAGNEESEPRQLTQIGGAYLGSPHWSPDGRWIAFDSRVDGHSAIFVVGAESGGTRRLIQNSFEEKRPSWSSDGKWIYFTSNRSGESRIWKTSIDGKTQQQVTDQLAFENSESPDGKFLYFSDRNRGVWRIPTDGGPVEALPGLEETRADLDWVVTNDGIAYIDDLGARDEALFYDFHSRRSRKLAGFPRPLPSSIPSFAISRDLQTLIFAQAKPKQSDLVAVRDWYRE